MNYKKESYSYKKRKLFLQKKWVIHTKKGKLFIQKKEVIHTKKKVIHTKKKVFIWKKTFFQRIQKNQGRKSAGKGRKSAGKGRKFPVSDFGPVWFTLFSFFGFVAGMRTKKIIHDPSESRSVLASCRVNCCLEFTQPIQWWRESRLWKRRLGWIL